MLARGWGAKNPHESRGHGVRNDCHSSGEQYLRSIRISSFEHYTGIIISLPTSWMMRFFDVRRWWLNIGCNKSLVHYTESSTTQDGLT